MKARYQKPTLKIKKIEINFFLNNFGLKEMRLTSLSDIGKCFLKGTKILMSDRSEKEIQNIKEGDVVLSYSIEDSKFVKSRVNHLLIHQAKTTEYVIINTILKATCEHKLRANDEWKRAVDLKVGDVLINQFNEKIKVTSIKKENKGIDTVYNLALHDRYHNYFAEGILARNYVVKPDSNLLSLWTT